MFTGGFLFSFVVLGLGTMFTRCYATVRCIYACLTVSKPGNYQNTQTNTSRHLSAD